MYSYAERLAAMRETKIRHTLEKRKQNGFTDLDDFGTVPISKGYCVEPWYNSSNGSFYGFDGMSENFCRVLDAHEPYVDPNEMLCGRWRDMLVNYRGDLHYMPDWLKDNLKNLEFIQNGATNQWSKRWDEQRFPYDNLKPWQEKYNITTGIDGDAHFACDYRIGFQLGFGGFLDKIRKYREVNPDKKDFYDAEERCVLAIISFVQRHIDKITAMLETEKDCAVREILRPCALPVRQSNMAPRKRSARFANGRHFLIARPVSTPATVQASRWIPCCCLTMKQMSRLAFWTMRQLSSLSRTFY